MGSILSGWAGTPWVVRNDSDLRTMSKNHRSSFGTLLGMIWAFFGQNIFFDFLGFLGVQTRLLGLWLSQLFLDKFFFRGPKVPKTVLNLSNELTRVLRPQKIGWNWILKKSRKFDFLTHLVAALWKVGKSGGPKISNFQKYRAAVRESS